MVCCCASQVSVPFKRSAHRGNGGGHSSRLSAICVHLILFFFFFFYVVEQLIYTFYEIYFSFQLCTTVQRFYILTLQKFTTFVIFNGFF